MGDGRENASHVGWYTGGRHEAVHASSAAGKVTITTLRGGWTHAGRLKAVEYEREGSMTDINAGQTMTVRSANGSSVRLRRYPGQQAGVLVNVPSGETVEACGEKINHKGLLWTPVRYDIYSGFMMSSFLKEGPPGGEDREIAAAEAFAALSARVAALEAWRKQAEGGLPV